jgi:GNAT superfamily N-acetyltransferase
MEVFKYTGTEASIDEVLDIFEETLIASPYEIEFNRAYWRVFITHTLSNEDQFTILLARVDERLVGVLVGQVYFGHPLVQFSKIAMEMFWYVNPLYRNNKSTRLLTLYEEWANDIGCTHTCVSTLENEHKDKLDRLYKHKGYVALETQYIKRNK